MASDKETPGDEFALRHQQYTQLGMDLEADLDKWAEELREQLARAGITYPKNGTVKEKWEALQAEKRKNRTAQQSLAQDVRAQIRDSRTLN